MVRLHDCDLVFDVRGIDPLSPSHTKRNANKPTAAEDDAAKDKTNKYMYLHNFNRSIEFFPFVYNLLGGLHKSADDLLVKIIKASPSYNPKPQSQLLREIKAELAFSIQRDNANNIRSSFDMALNRLDHISIINYDR